IQALKHCLPESLGHDKIRGTMGFTGNGNFGDDGSSDELAKAMAFLNEPPATPADQAPAPDSSFTPPATPLVFAPGVFVAPSPDTMLSKYFSVENLTTTTHAGVDNSIDSQETLDNLKQLGVALDAIKDNVGDFAIASAYRSQALQDIIRGEN